MIISRKNSLAILNAGLATGADYAEIYYQDNRGHNYTRRYKKVYSISSNRTCGVGIRLLQGTKCVYGYTSDLSTKSLMKLAADLAQGFEGKQVKEVTSLTEKKHGNLNQIKIPHSSWTTEQKLAYLEDGEKEAYKYSDQIKDVMARLFEEDEHVEIYNSDGVFASDDRVRTRIMSLVVASDGKQFQTAFEGPGLSAGLELLESTDYKAQMLQCAQNAVAMLSAPEGPSGEMPVVLGNAFGGVLFHESCGHPLEGSAISHKTSPFTGKLGKTIASPIVNAFDNGVIENGWGTENIDDEGNTPSANQLIKDGVLVNYMLDRYTSRRIDSTLGSTGACRRENYRYTPTTRMTNTYIGNGTSTKDDIIKSVKKGIYCVGFTGGQVDPSTDQFIFTSSTAYTIEDGKIGHLIKPVSLIGYGYEILPNITMIADDLQRAPGVCGAASGSCYVEVGQPTLLISKMLVGSAGGNN
ncbi:MAG: TldD/PmbA family protein [Bacilli bacterium]